RERMEAMNREKLEEYFVQIYTSKIGHDNYNRYFTDSEKQRMEQLKEKYENEGKFPEGELTLIDQPEQYKGKKVAYYPETGTFFFPDKEMSDEELLQIIDFRCKRDYSLQKMNEMIASGESKMPEEALQKKKPETLTEASILNSDVIWEPDQELTIAYTGDLSVTAMAAGKKYIYLGGWNTVHRMEIGGRSSEVFFDGFEKETRVTCIYVDQDENIYVAGAKMNTEKKVTSVDGEYASPATSPVLCKLGSDGNLLKEIPLSAYYGKYGDWIFRMAVDQQGYIYLRSTALLEANQILVIDENGSQISIISSGDYQFHVMGGLDVGKDGKVYTTVMKKRKSKSEKREMGIASINIEEGRLEDVYLGIVPKETILIELLAPGADTDFVFWGVDGVFNYNLGESDAVHKTPAYEMPCEVEGAKYCSLPDGRIVLAACTEFFEESYGGEFKRTLWKPQSAYFYYLSGMRGE
ncbi:MAG: hypothetical protein K2N82_13235, partial [Lachnospiraceae bacterium]|nr:hypothetical protein [Lachnospiraceae bacterium]